MTLEQARKEGLSFTGIYWNKEDETIKKMKQLTTGRIKAPVSLCGLAKYIYGAMYPELCKLSPSMIWEIAGYAEGNNNSRNIILEI